MTADAHPRSCAIRPRKMDGNHGGLATEAPTRVKSTSLRYLKR